MRLLFVAYCMVDNENGDSLIGVYKRCLRIGVEMHRRGHEVHILCDQRHRFRDPLAKVAGKIFRFLDLPMGALFRSEHVRRRYIRGAIQQRKFDMVVIGECPLGGSLLDVTLAASELEIPLVLLDNAYGPVMAKLFVWRHGNLFDGVILTGPASFHPRKTKPFYCGVPPLVSGDADAAAPLLDELKLRSGNIVTVLGYERKAETLAINLLLENNPNCDFLFIVRNPEQTLQRLESLPPELKAKTRVIDPPAESVLFSLLRHSRLAIGKCGFMQVSESLALRTPFLALYYRGCFSRLTLPARARRYVHSTTSTDAEPGTVRAFERLLNADPEDIAKVHDGRFDALERMAQFLEDLPKTRRPGLGRQAERWGYKKAMVAAALTQKHSGKAIEVDWIRCMRMHDMLFGRIDCLAVAYRSEGVPRFTTLCGRRYWSLLFGRMLLRRATRTIPENLILFRAPGGRSTIEEGREEGYKDPPSG